MSRSAAEGGSDRSAGLDTGAVMPRGRPVFHEAPTVIGHRGLGKGTVSGCAENTIESFLAALQAGLGWLEVDVRRTADDGLFVTHDPAFGDGAFLTDLTGVQAAERGALPLSDLLDAVPDSAGIVFDLKSSMADSGRPAAGTTAALLAPIAAQQARRRPVAATSFDPAAVAHLRQHAPDVAVGLLTWLSFPAEHAIAAAAHLDIDLLVIHAGSLLPEGVTATPPRRSVAYVVDQIHDSQRQLIVWCPAADQVSSLAAAGVDAIIVDDVPTVVANLPARAGLI